MTYCHVQRYPWVSQNSNMQFYCPSFVLIHNWCCIGFRKRSLAGGEDGEALRSYPVLQCLRSCKQLTSTPLLCRQHCWNLYTRFVKSLCDFWWRVWWSKSSWHSGGEESRCPLAKCRFGIFASGVFCHSLLVHQVTFLR